VVKSTVSYESNRLSRITIERKSRNRHLRLRITGYRSLVVSAPSRASDKRIRKFIDDNHAWIQAQPTWNKPLFYDGKSISPQRKLRLNTQGRAWEVTVDSHEISITLPAAVRASSVEAQQAIYKHLVDYLRSKSKQQLPQRAHDLAREHSFRFNSIRLKNITSRWGSYSSKQNLNLAIQLIRLPTELIDHVILHELCHSRQMSHDPAFWREFESVRPQFRSERKQLHKYQLWRKPC
ncbi:MAG: YgjP-like metallopeptidase domain-containing protein, partial [Candidatus Saccharimonadales bacterium]|nr:YgjP-like metallopeptidase domain-containing protein [Candidatus Saccharimonadales bacterium]